MKDFEFCWALEKDSPGNDLIWHYAESQVTSSAVCGIPIVHIGVRPITPPRITKGIRAMCQECGVHALQPAIFALELVANGTAA